MLSNLIGQKGATLLIGHYKLRSNSKKRLDQQYTDQTDIEISFITLLKDGRSFISLTVAMSSLLRYGADRSPTNCRVSNRNYES